MYKIWDSRVLPRQPVMQGNEQGDSAWISMSAAMLMVKVTNMVYLLCDLPLVYSWFATINK